jgi:hypothetical protein
MSALLCFAVSVLLAMKLLDWATSTTERRCNISFPFASRQVRAGSDNAEGSVAAGIRHNPTSKEPGLHS